VDARAISGARADAAVLAVSNLRVTDNNIGALIGVLGAIVVAVLLLNGGGYFGKTTIRGDADLPPVASPR
jgi:hypothetical protein